MANQLKFGDHLYIEVSTISSENENEEKQSYLLGSNAFLDENLYAVDSKDCIKNSFLNCIFVVVPYLLDAQDDIDLTTQLESEVNDFLLQEGESSNETRKKHISEIKTKIEDKKVLIKEKKATVELLNEKIMVEAQSRPIKFGEVIMLQHLLSGSFLRGQQNSHPLDRALLNITLTDVRNSDCYFKLFSSISATSNEVISYGEEVRIASCKHKTFLSIGNTVKESQFIKNLDKSDDENYKKFQTFPPEFQRVYGLDTFGNEKYPVGLKYENKSTYAIKLLPYLSSEDYQHIKMNKSIKNGDFIRLHFNDYYLTVNPGNLIDKESIAPHVSFNRQEVDNYEYNSINTIFQIIQTSSDDRPTADEIHANPKKLKDHRQAINFYLKHYFTGYYFGIDDKYNFVLISDQDNETDKRQNIDIPFAQIMAPANVGANEFIPVSRNSSFSLRFFKFQDNVGEYLNDGRYLEIGPYIQRAMIQTEIDKQFYFGRENPEDHVEDILKLTKRELKSQGSTGPLFNITGVLEKEMQKIYEMDSYAKFLRIYIRNINAIRNRNMKVKLSDFNKLTLLAVEGSLDFFKKLIKNDIDISEDDEIIKMNVSELIAETSIQMLVRESGLLVLINKIIYYLLIDAPNKGYSKSYSQIKYGAGTSAIEETIDVVNLTKLLTILVKIIMLCIKNNIVNERYNSQYVRVYISVLLKPNGFFNNKYNTNTEKLQDILLPLVLSALTEEDELALQQLSKYGDIIFEHTLHNSNLQMIYIKLLNHISNVKAPNFENYLRLKLIDALLTNNQLRNFLPELNSKDTRNPSCIIKRTGYPNLEYSLTEHSKELDYTLSLLELLNTLCSKKSYAFLAHVIEIYPLNSCIKLLNQTKALFPFRDQLSRLMKKAHMTYRQLEFEPPKFIQFLFENSSDYEKKIDKLYLEAKDSLIHYEEKEILRKADLFSVFHIQNDNVSHNKTTISKPTTNASNKDHQIKKSKSVLPLEAEEVGVEQDIDYQSHRIDNMLSHIFEHRMHTWDDEFWVSLQGTYTHIWNLLNDIANYEESKNNDVPLQNTLNGKLFFHKYSDIFEIIHLMDMFLVQKSSYDYIAQVRTIMKNDPSLLRLTTLIADHDSEDIINSENDDPQRPNEQRKKNPISSLAESEAIRGNLASKLHSDTSLEQQYNASKVTEVLVKLIEKGSIEIVSKVIHSFENKVKFEENVYKEIKKWSILNSEEDAKIFHNILNSMLKCNEIARRIKVFNEFKVNVSPDSINEIIKEFRLHFEVLLDSLYDINKHMNIKDNEEEDEISQRKAEYFNRFYESKIQKLEIPFIFNPLCIRTKFQRLMKPFKIYEILIPLIKIFSNFEQNKEDFLVLSKYIMNIMTLFVYKNKENQEELSKYNELITIYYNNDILNSSAELISLAIEIFRSNRKLLALNHKYLMDIIYSVFLSHIKKMNFLENPDQVTDASLINAMRSLIIICQSNLPRDLFDPILEFANILKTFASYIEQKSMSDQNIFGIGKESYYEVSIFNNIFDEFLYSFNEYIKSAPRESILGLQKQISLKPFLNLLQNELIEFNYNIKWKIINIIHNLYYGKARKPNLFENDEDFEQFLSLLLIDLDSFIHWDLNIEEDIKICTKESCFFFSIEKIANRIQRANDMVKKTSKDLLYKIYQFNKRQNLMWNRYINMLLLYLADLFDFERERIIEIKDKDEDDFQNFFDIFLPMLTNFSNLLTDSKSLKFVEAYNDFLKRIIIIPEYIFDNDIKEKLIKLKMNSDGLLEALKEKNENGVKEQNEVSDIGKIILKNIEKAQTRGATYRESNIKEIAKCIASNGEFNEGCISKLILFLNQDNKNVLRKDIIFVLKLLRNIIEIQISGISDEPIYQWDDISAADLEKIEIAQNKLNEYNIVNAIFQLLYNNKDDIKITKEAFLISLALIYGGNKEAQDAFYNEFRSDSENEIVELLSKILDDSFSFLIENENHKNKRLYFKAQSFLLNHLKHEEKNSGDKVNMAKLFYRELKISNKTKPAERRKIDQKYTIVTILLKFLQSLCENHNNDFQNFLREQMTIEGDKIHHKSFNFISYLRRTFEDYYPVINVDNIDIGIKVIDLLIEVIQGEVPQNTQLMLKKSLMTDLCSVLVIFDGDVDLLPRGFAFNKYDTKFHNIKSKALNLLKNLIERSDGKLLNKMIKCINVDSLVGFLSLCFTKYAHDKGALPHRKNLEMEEYTKSQYLMDGFTAYIVLKYIWQDCSEEEFDKNIRNVFEKAKLSAEERRTMSYILFNFCKKYVGSVEILQKKTNHLMKIYFPIYVIYDYLGADVKENFEENVDRSNSQAKVEELMNAVPEFINMATLEYDARNRFLGLNMFVIYSGLRFATDTLAIIVNLINMFTLHYLQPAESESDNIENSISTDAEPIANGEGNDEPLVIWQDARPQVFVSTLCGINCIISLCLMVVWLFTKSKSCLKKKWEEYSEANSKDSNEGRNLENEIEGLTSLDGMSDEFAMKVLKYGRPYTDAWNKAKDLCKAFFYFKSIYYLIHDGSFMWHIFFFFICAGSGFHPIICGLQLLDIVVRSDTVSRIAIAVSQNARQFLWTLVLLLTVLYIYSLIGLYFLQDVFIDEDGETRLCKDEYSCFLFHINYGLRSGGGISDVIQKASYDPDSRWSYFTRTVYDLSFFITFIILLLNLIFGMIIDSFGDLRDEKNSSEDDRKNVCFICGMPRAEIERYFDFEMHLNSEHNKWLYLAYLLYIEQKHENLPTELTDFESYVWERYSKQDFEWVPIGRSLTLEKIFEHDEKAKKSDVELITEELKDIIQAGNEESKMLVDDLKAIKLMIQRSFGIRNAASFKGFGSR